MKRGYDFGIEDPRGIRLDSLALKYKVPSIFTTEMSPYDGLTDRYAVIPTIHALQELDKQGFRIVLAMQARTRSKNSKVYAQHLIRLRHVNDLGYRDAVEFVLTNSDNGDSCFRLDHGHFTLVCWNGLVFGEYESYRVRHQGAKTAARVVESTLALAKGQGEIRDKVEQWKGITLPQDERLLLAQLVHKERFGEDYNGLVTPQELLKPRHRAYEPVQNTLYGTVQILQYAVIHGGQSHYSSDAGKYVTARGVNAIDTSTRLNKLITVEAEALRVAHSH